MMKKSTMLFLTVCILLTGFTVFAQDNVGLIINESLVQTDQAPFIEDGTTFVPIRVVSENLGCEVFWDGGQQKVEVQKDDTEFSLYIGMDYAITKNGPLQIAKAPRIVNSRTMIPIRAVAELLNCKVDWLGTTRTVYIDSPASLKRDSDIQCSKVYPEKDWVYQANEYREWYTDSVENEYHPHYQIPAINLTSEDAAAINREIAADIEADYQNTLQVMKEGNSLSSLGVTYEYYVNNDIVSLGIIFRNDLDTIDITWYNINKATGKRISNSELVATLGYTESQFVEKLKEVTGNYYLATTGINASAVGDEFYQDRYNYTISDEACNMKVPLYIGENGHLYAVARIGSLAGASSYNHLVDTGIAVNNNAPTFTVGRALECIGVWRNTTSGLQGLLPHHDRGYITVHPDEYDDIVITDPNYNGYTVPAYRIIGASNRQEVTNYLLEYVTDDAERNGRLTETVFELGGVEYSGALYAYELGFTGIHFFNDNARQLDDADGYKRIAIGADHYDSEWIFCFKIEDGRWKIDKVIKAEN